MGVGFGGINHENVSPVVNPEFPEFLGGIVQGVFIDFGSITRFWVSGNTFEHMRVAFGHWKFILA